MAADSPPAGGGIDDVFPAWWKNNLRAHPALSPADGGEGRATKARQGASLAVERADSTGTPTRGAPGIDFAPETKTSAVSPRRANPEQADDASALAESLLDVTLVPETTVQSVPDVTSSPPGGLTAVVVADALWGKEYHVVAAVEGHELKTPETEHRPGLERLLETTIWSLTGSCSSTRSRPLPGAPTVGVSTPGGPWTDE